MSAQCAHQSIMLKWWFDMMRADHCLRKASFAVMAIPCGSHFQLKLSPWSVLRLVKGYTMRTWRWQMRTSTQWTLRDTLHLGGRNVCS